MNSRGLPRTTSVLVLAAALASVTGCAYVRNRGKDALDMVDIGFTFTRKPQFGIYANCPFLFPVGYTKVDGKYAGLGGGKFGITEHHQDATGLLVSGHERIEWRDPNTGEASAVQAHNVAPLGLASDEEGNATYKPQCAHYLHLGYVGVTSNLNYKEWGDFFAGWAGFDICRDDNRWLKSVPDQRPAPTMLADRSRVRRGLALVARARKSSFAVGEPIVLDVRLENHTARPEDRISEGSDLTLSLAASGTAVLGAPERSPFTCLVFDGTTMRVRHSGPLSAGADTPFAPTARSVVIRRGASIERRLVCSLPRGDLAPGSYLLLISYEAAANSPGSWQGKLCSNSVPIRIEATGQRASLAATRPDVVSTTSSTELDLRRSAADKAL